MAIMFAAAAIPLTIAVSAAVDFSRLAAGRSALQRAADSAAISGAAAYVLYTQGDTYNAVARNVGSSAFCNAVATLPAGFTVVAVTGGGACGALPGPVVAAVIGGYAAGTRGIAPASGCSATNTIVAGATCGFIVTVTSAATMDTNLPFIYSSLMTVSVTASAANPFINLATALSPTFHGSARYTDSLWVYPLLLDANGNPDFVSNPGALPDASACTGAPTQTNCGSYVMVANTGQVACTTANPCTINGTVFGGSGGVVQNPAFGNVVITSTTPLGIALETSAGAPTAYPYNSASPQPANRCTYPATVVYNTVSQAYGANGAPLVVDSAGRWALPTHWFYSSFLANRLPPSEAEILAQADTTTNATTGLANNIQVVPSVPVVSGGVATPTSCANPTAYANNQHFITSFPSTGNTNCSLYILKDPASLTPNPNLKVGFGQQGSCYTPANTPGAAYAALSCQSFAGHSYVFFWNDMGGQTFDDTDYNNGILQVTCAGASYVVLIN